MNLTATLTLAALATLAFAGNLRAEGTTTAAPAADSAQAQPGAAVDSKRMRAEKRLDPRPEDPTANLPSDSGAQSELPSGAVTGAGHAHGTIRHPDLGAPGGLEERARAQAREQIVREGGSADDASERTQRAIERASEAKR